MDKLRMALALLMGIGLLLMLNAAICLVMGWALGGELLAIGATLFVTSMLISAVRNRR
jgi:hypothetical protein